MHCWISQIRLIFCILDTLICLIFHLFLYLCSELMAVIDAGSTDFQAIIYITHLPARVIEAVHATTSWLVIHYIEFFVQKGVKLGLSCFDSRDQVINHLFMHVFDSVLSVFRHFVVLTKLFLGHLCGVFIHLLYLFQFLPSFIFIITPILFNFLCTSEKSWNILICLFVFLPGKLLEFFSSFLGFQGFFLIVIQETKRHRIFMFLFSDSFDVLFSF